MKKLIAIIAFFTLCIPSIASAQTNKVQMVFHVKVNSYRTPTLMIYNASRNYRWKWGPYVLKPNNAYTYMNISCNHGEKLHIGAWSGKMDWGCGKDCWLREKKNLMYTCSNSVNNLTLNVTSSYIKTSMVFLVRNKWNPNRTPVMELYNGSRNFRTKWGPYYIWGYYQYRRVYISCVSGHRIYFGAWYNNIHWGCAKGCWKRSTNLSYVCRHRRRVKIALR